MRRGRDATKDSLCGFDVSQDTSTTTLSRRPSLDSISASIKGGIGSDR
jgi:hypothetical protein